jgi:cell division transport system permease protein
MGVTILMALVSIIIVFNTIRLAIYVARDEIAVMRLVGANNRYIRGPFTIAGIMYGAIAGLLTLGLFYPATYWFSKVTGSFFGGINLFMYYNTHFLEVFGIIMLAGIILGAVSSYLAIRKYLRI